MNSTWRRSILRAFIIGLKLCALATVLQAVLIHYATRVVTVLMTSVPSGISQVLHRPIFTSYTYVSDVRPLSFGELKWALLVGVALYAEALLIQTVANRKHDPRQPAKATKAPHPYPQPGVATLIVTDVDGMPR